MILIVGGREQGKLSFALSLPGALPERFEIRDAADGRRDGFEKAVKSALIIHLERYVRRLLENGEDPAAWIDVLIAEGKDKVILADEIGAGIVPVDAFEREYRETAGRMCQRLAAASDSVYRVLSGIGMKIK